MEKEFRINSSLAAFETLSTRLYANPVLAVIRELSTNAHDSHIESHIDRPFRLHLPTREEMYFDIRDYGKGLSEEFVYNIYTTFFMSTKSEDDGQTGYFGLGSKTPFALVDSYKVTSYNGGMKKVYEMAKESTGPVVRKLSEEPCGDETGLEVYFDIYNDDLCYDFHKEATEFFKGTTFMPAWNIEMDMASYAKEKEFYIRESVELGSVSSYSYYRRRISVNVAGVRFDVDDAHESELDSFLIQTDVKRVNILAKKNNVTITPSREELHYDQKTKDFLKQEVKRVVLDFYRKAKESVDDASFDTLINYISSQTYDKELADKASGRLGRYFLPTIYMRGCSKYSLKGHTSASGIESTSKINGRKIILDFSNVKDTVKRNVVLGVINGDTVADGKIKSEAFKKILQTVAEQKKENIICLVPQIGMLEEARKWTGFEALDWNEVVPEKKKPKKAGFITQATISAKDGHDFYSRGTELGDNDVGLVALCSPDTISCSGYRKMLAEISFVVRDTVFYLRPCTENNISQFKSKGFMEIGDYMRKLREDSPYSAKIEEIAGNRLDNEIFSSFFSSFSESNQKILMERRYDLLEKYGFFRALRKHYHPQTFVRNDIKFFFTVDEGIMADSLKESMESAFPMTKNLYSLDGHDGLRDNLEYMLAWDAFISARKNTEVVA